MVKNLPANQYRRRKRGGFDPWVGKIPGGGHGNPLQYSCLKNTMDREAQQATVQRIEKSLIGLKQLSTAQHTAHTHCLKQICPQSSPKYVCKTLMTELSLNLKTLCNLIYLLKHALQIFAFCNIFVGFPSGTAVKNQFLSGEDTLEQEMATQCFCQENPMDRVA